MTTSPVYYSIPLVDPASIQDPEEQTTIPDLNAKIELINNCLAHISIRIQDIIAFNTHLNEQPLDKEWVYLHSDYIDLQREIKYVIETAKPLALKLIGELPTNSKGCNGEIAMAIFKRAIGDLQRKNLEVLKNINESVYANEIQFPIPPELPSVGFIEDCASVTTKNRGPLITVVAGTIALATLTPLGRILGPYIGAIPKATGSACAGIGNTIGDFLSSGFEPAYLDSKTVKTAGQIACCVAFIYPTYSYFNKPVTQFLKSLHLRCNQVLAKCSNHPKITGLCASGASWVVLHSTGIAEKTGPYVHPAITSGLMGLGTTYAIDYTRPIVNDLALEEPIPMPLPARIIPDQYPIDVPYAIAPRRPVVPLARVERPAPPPQMRALSDPIVSMPQIRAPQKNQDVPRQQEQLSHREPEQLTHKLKTD